MIKTSIKELLDVLPEPFRGKAIINCKKDEPIYGELSFAINAGFTWEQTTEGHYYWDSLYSLTEKKVAYVKTEEN